MKPDPHKQKKNNAYKKKHDIPSDKKKADQQTGDARGAASGAREVGSARVSAGASQSAASGASSKTELSTGIRNLLLNQETEDGNERRTFSRRKVTSNWDKYEEAETCIADGPSLRGADLQELLQSSASILSQFQFRDEDDLIGNRSIADDQRESSAAFLSVNCESLAASLAGISLHERLGLDASLFEPEQIAAYESEAGAAVQIYLKTLLLSNAIQHDDSTTPGVTSAVTSTTISSFAADELDEILLNHADSLPKVSKVKELLNGSSTNNETLLARPNVALDCDSPVSKSALENVFIITADDEREQLVPVYQKLDDKSVQGSDVSEMIDSDGKNHPEIISVECADGLMVENDGVVDAERCSGVEASVQSVEPSGVKSLAELEDDLDSLLCS